MTPLESKTSIPTWTQRMYRSSCLPRELTEDAPDSMSCGTSSSSSWRQRSWYLTDIFFSSTGVLYAISFRSWLFSSLIWPIRTPTLVIGHALYGVANAVDLVCGNERFFVLFYPHHGLSLRKPERLCWISDGMEIFRDAFIFPASWACSPISKDVKRPILVTHFAPFVLWTPRWTTSTLLPTYGIPRSLYQMQHYLSLLPWLVNASLIVLWLTSVFPVVPPSPRACNRVIILPEL